MHLLHFSFYYSQTLTTHAFTKHLIYAKFTKHTKFPSATTSDSSNDPPNWSTITKLFLLQERNIRQRGNNDTTCASRINMEMDVLTNKVAEASQHEINTDNYLAILN